MKNHFKFHHYNLFEKIFKGKNNEYIINYNLKKLNL